MQAGIDAALALATVKQLAGRFTGDHEMTILVERDGEIKRTLTLGPLWTFDGSDALLSQLEEFGVPRLAHDR
jgi:hypothetical protein